MGAVEGEVVHGELLELVSPRVELVQVVLQVGRRKLLQLHLGQPRVRDLEAAPQGVHSLQQKQLYFLLQNCFQNEIEKEMFVEGSDRHKPYRYRLS